MRINTQEQVDQAEKVLRLSWVIVFGVILFSVFTVTPLVERSTPAGWEWSAPILPLVVDVAVVISIRVDAIVSRLGGSTTGWPLALRVLTGGASVALNVGHSVLQGDLVGALVHTAAPAVLIVVAEASLKWRKEIAAASARIESERREREDARRREQREREEQARADREREQEAQRLERERQEAADRERRREEMADREREREHAARLAREEREHAAALERDRLDREERARHEEQARIDRERREKRERDERERREQEAARKAKEAAQKAARERQTPEPGKPALAPVSAAVSTPRPAVSATVSTAAHETDKPAKMSEADARQAVIDGVSAGRSQREIATLTGWSTGWVAKRVMELGEAA
ncbi:DUF2637 domain-containing protein [Streptomyces sp. NPDC101221]|uniref:DUF2637 domain-containing protein n=1 Tax=Streptomyces sp. NPDC101221 TaxID=3366132 RepID=UPI0037F86AB5